MFILYAFVSSLAMGFFYILDLYFGHKGLYSRPSQAMIVSAIVPLLSIPYFVLQSEFTLISPVLTALGVLAGVILIWANWFYFLVIFPIDKSKREVEAVEGATELALYEGTTPVIVLVLSLILSQSIIYTDSVSVGQGFAIVLTVLSLVLFALSDGYEGFNRWSYRFKLIAFSLLVSCSQLIQDIVVNHLQSMKGMTIWEAYFSTAPLVWLGMFSGILIVCKADEWSRFKQQWNKILKRYVILILIAEFIAIGSYAALIASYTGEHVAVAGAIAATFPIIVFVGGLLLVRAGRQEYVEVGDVRNIIKKLLLILLTLCGVIGVIVL